MKHEGLGTCARRHWQTSHRAVNVSRFAAQAPSALASGIGSPAGASSASGGGHYLCEGGRLDGLVWFQGPGLTLLDPPLVPFYPFWGGVPLLK